MDRLKTLNDMKALTMKQKHIIDVMDADNMNNPYQTHCPVVIEGKNINVDAKALKEFLEQELKRTKIKYDDFLKALLDEEGGF